MKKEASPDLIWKKKKVCFMPRQPLRLYQGDRRREEDRNNNDNKTSKRRRVNLSSRRRTTITNTSNSNNNKGEVENGRLGKGNNP